ncbi:MFS transporter [Streptomyces olivoreticuli]|uniref:MFS transporter n=1 Tax=Streptomyces olivoreticuli TaxID=68246 RepID=UPI00265933F4|nr:MFS transporter [Streptomyces olivoreticuli]WKK23579.1 MFS transporter [Streptomyces olivoreticuli]
MHNPTVQSPEATGHPRRKAVLATMCAAVILVVSMVSAVNLAVPKLAKSDLQPSTTQLLWFVDSYVIVFACLLIPAGAVGDRYGRRRSLTWGLGVFALGCLVCAVAPGITVLLAGRVITGVGAAFVMPATLSLALYAFPPAERPQAIATWTGASGIGGVVGYLLGGGILQFLPWQGLFIAMVPVTGIVMFATRLAPAPPRHASPVDPLGTVLLVLGFVALLYGVIEGPSLGWSSTRIICAFAVGAALLCAFALQQSRSERPMLEPRLFRSHGLRAGTLGVTAAFFAMFALFFTNAQYLQYVKGLRPFTAGVAFLPLAVCMMLVSRRSARLSARFGARGVMVTGAVLIALALLCISYADASTPYALYAVYLLAAGGGMGLCLPPLSTSIMTSLPPQRAGLGSGLNSAAREVGSALGVAVIGTITTSRFSQALGDPSVHAHRRSASEVFAAATRIGPAEHARAVDAFSSAAGTGYRVVAAVLLVAALLAVFWHRAADRPATAVPKES